MIPWDYDIDIMMPREGLNKFLELTKNQDAIENITVFSWITHKDYYAPFVKICDSRTRLVITKTTNPPEEEIEIPKLKAYMIKE